MEKRMSFLESEFRTEQEEEKLFIEGYFIRFNTETELFPGVYEEIAPESVTRSLLQNDVRCLFNHESGMVLGRTGNGTVELRADEKGVWGKVEINKNDPEAMGVYARIQRGDVDGCSFGFYPLDEEVVNRSDGTTKFIVRDIDLLEVSAVTWPAYPQTEIAARKRDIEKLKREKMSARKKQLKERLKHG